MAYEKGTDLGIFEKFMKEFYLSRWIDMLTGATTLWQLFRQDVVDYTGKYMVIPLRTGRNASPQFISRSTTAGAGLTQLSVPGHQQVDYALPSPRLFTGSIMLPQDTIDQAKGDRGAFYDAVDFEMMGLLRDSKERLDAIVVGDGAGRMPYYMWHSATHTDYSVTYMVPSVLSIAATVARVNGAPYWFVGKRIQAFNADYSVHHTGQDAFAAAGLGCVKSVVNNGDGTANITIAAGVDYNGAAVDLGAEPTTAWAAGAHIHDYGSFNWTSGTAFSGQAMHGLCSMVADADPQGEAGSWAAGVDVAMPGYLGINRTSAYPWWKGIVDYGTTAAYDWSVASTGNPALVLQTMCDRVHDESLGEVDMILMCRWASRVMMSLTAGGINPPQSKQRYVNSIKTWMGFMSQDQDKHPGKSDWVMFNDDTPVIVDKYLSPWTTVGSGDPVRAPVWCMDSNTVYLGVVTDFSWWDPGGQIFLPVPGGSALNYFFGVVANIYALMDWVCDAPNRNGFFPNIKIGANLI